MLDLKTQLSDYLDHVVQRLEVEDILEERVGSEPVQPVQPRFVRRSISRWVYGVAAAVVLLLLVGGVGWLAQQGEDDVVDQSTTTIPPPVPVGGGGVLGPGSWSVAATFSDGTLSPEQLTEVGAWPGVLEVAEVVDQAAWLQFTGLESQCNDGDASPPCGAGIVALVTTNWMDQAALRLESEFGMTAITAFDVPRAFIEGYLNAAERNASPVQLGFDPGALGTEQPLGGPIIQVSGEVTGEVCDTCDVVVETEVDGFVVVAGLEIPDEPGFSVDVILEVSDGGGTGFNVIDFLVDGFGEGGVLANLDGAFGGRRVYAFAGLPLQAAVIGFELADGSMIWQQPRAGMALIVDKPRTPGFEDGGYAPVGPPFKVFNADGVEIMRIEDKIGRPVVTDLRVDPDAISQSKDTPLPLTEEAAALTGKIAFVRGDSHPNLPGSDTDIYVMNADGSNVVRLTDSPVRDTFPSWSPDGTRIAFVSDRDGNPEIYVMNADGSNQTRLTDSRGLDEDPVWSPDGTRIAFESGPVGDQEIYVMNADGSNVLRLTENSDLQDVDPSWSPDGTQIVFVSARDNDFVELYVMDADGSNVTRLSTYDGSARLAGDNPNVRGGTSFTPAWSPDGSRIAFGTWVSDNTYAIYVVDSDGSNVVPVADDWFFAALAPAWSPDGTRIVYQGFPFDADPSNNIYVMDADGSNVIQLTNHPGFDGFPEWTK